MPLKTRLQFLLLVMPTLLVLLHTAYLYHTQRPLGGVTLAWSISVLACAWFTLLVLRRLFITLANQQHTIAELRQTAETSERENIELGEAYRRAQQTSRFRFEFLANMSHEIRTPLTGMAGFCRLLQRSQLGPRQRDWLDHIETTSSNLLSLMKNILDFSKIEAGKLELESTPIDIAALIDEVLLLQMPFAQQKRLHLLALVDDEVPDRLSGDPLRIKQILTNLVHNAIKFTAHGEVIVRVSAEEANAGSDEHIMTLGIQVSDSGIGLTEDLQKRLFEPFKQGLTSRSSHHGGTGLGLAICKQLIGQMGGEIQVHSQPGKGSSFDFTLPLMRLGNTDSCQGQHEPALHGALIALHEPHATARHAISHQLESWRARVLIVEARHDYSDLAQHPDLLCIGLEHTDFIADNLAGWNRYLAAVPCPVLILANTDPFTLSWLKLPQGSNILHKPITRARLANMLTQLLDGSAKSSTQPREEPIVYQSQARVLVIDDILSNRHLVGELLAQMGIEALLAESGEEALVIASTQSVDMVLLDINMPGMDGVETLQALRAFGGSWQECPYIALTAHILEEQVSTLLGEGIQEVLSKPVDEHELARVLALYLGLSPMHNILPRLPVTQPHSEKRPPPIDMALGRTKAGGSDDLARENLEMLIDTLGDSEARIRHAHAESDSDALLDAVHYLNGACRYCGVPQLALLVDDLERQLRTRGLVDVSGKLEELYAAMQRLRECSDHRQLENS